MKKILKLLTMVALIFSTLACSSGKAAETAADTDTTADATKDFDGSSYSEMGQGSFGIVNQSGSTLEGNDVVVFVDNPKTDLIQIGYESLEMDGSTLTYIYIDGMLNDKVQIGDSQGSLTLAKEWLSEGEHLVEAVQFDGDEPGGEVKTYKPAKYTIKLN